MDALRSGKCAASATRVLAEEGDPVSVLHLAVEGVGEAQNRVVHENLDVLSQIATRPVPEDLLKLRKTIAQPAQDAPHRGAGADGFVEDLPASAVTSNELGHPGNRLNRHPADFGLRIADCGLNLGRHKSYLPHRGGMRCSRPRARSVSGRGRPVLRS